MSRVLDRRRFLKGASGLLLGLTQFRDCAYAASANSADWQDLARSLKGSLLQKNHPDFARIATPWNLHYASNLPAGIARCASPEEVRTSLLWATANGCRSPFARAAILMRAIPPQAAS
jgi:hypothetical protein